jgi:hypothetical protein
MHPSLSAQVFVQSIQYDLRTNSLACACPCARACARTHTHTHTRLPAHAHQCARACFSQKIHTTHKHIRCTMDNHTQGIEPRTLCTRIVHTRVLCSLFPPHAFRASRQAINTTFGVLARRLGLDPWLPLDTTITNSMVGTLSARLKLPLRTVNRRAPQSPLSLTASFSQPRGAAAPPPLEPNFNPTTVAQPRRPGCFRQSNSLQSWQQGGWGEQSYYPTTNPVDVPDATYLPRFATPVTVTPFYSWCANWGNECRLGADLGAQGVSGRYGGARVALVMDAVNGLTASPFLVSAWAVNKIKAWIMAVLSVPTL